MNAGGGRLDLDAPLCVCGFGSLIEEAQRQLDALSPEEGKASRERREGLRFQAARYLLHGTSTVDRRLAATYLMQLKGAP